MERRANGPAAVRAIRAAALLAIAATPLLAASSSDPWQLSFRALTPEIDLAYRPEPLRFLVEGNVTLIFGANDVVVVDGSGSPRAARQVIAHIRARTSNPVSILVNTHGHGDHTLGNQEYAREFPGVEIVARPETREYLTGQGIGYVAQIAESTASRKRGGAEEIERLEKEGAPGDDAVIANLRQYYEHDLDVRQQEYRAVRVTPPTLTFTDRLTLHRPGREIDLLYLGPGDTHGDVVVFLPDDRLVVTGDMVVHPFPYGFSRHPLEWAETLDRLAALDFDTLVPGHGEVQQGKAYLAQVSALLRDVQAQVARGLDRGLDLEAIRAAVDLTSWRDALAGDDPVRRYFFRVYFAEPNVERTYDELAARRSTP